MPGFHAISDDLRKCLEKSPTRRYNSAQELAAELTRSLRGEPIVARPIGHVARLWRWCQRNPIVAGLSTTALLLLGLVALATSVGFVTTSCALDASQFQTRRAEASLVRETTARHDMERQKAIAEEKTREALVQKQRADQQLLHSEWLLYVGQIASARREWDVNNPAAAWHYLSACRWDFRGYEYNYLYTLFQKNQRTFIGRAGSVSGLAFSPDGARIVSSNVGSRFASNGISHPLIIWDVVTGQEVLALEGHTEPVFSVAFSPNGKLIVSGSGDKTLKLWDAVTGQEILSLKGHAAEVTSVAFSPDGKRIVSGSGDKTLRVWNAVMGQEILTLKGHTEPVSSVAFSPDGKLIVSGSWDKTLKIWNVTTGREVITLKGHKNRVLSAAFSPDGKRIVSGGGDNMLKIWDATTGREVLTLNGHTGWVSSVAFGPDGKRILSGSFDEMVKIWDISTGQEAFTLKGHTGAVASVAFSPDGKRIASGSHDATLKVWDASTGQEDLKFKGHTGAGS